MYQDIASVIEKLVTFYNFVLLLQRHIL